jgi:predicted O-methyltransferase YrrM
LDSRVEAVLAEYDRRAESEMALITQLSHEEVARRVDEFLISIGPDTGSFKSARAQTILELGTSYGHSTVFLAKAAAVTGGRVITIDVGADKQRHAHAKLVAAGLESAVDFCTGDAREIIATLPGPFDFVLIDLWKDLYIPCFDLVFPKLADGAFLAADNILSPEFTRN